MSCFGYHKPHQQPLRIKLKQLINNCGLPKCPVAFSNIHSFNVKLISSCFIPVCSDKSLIHKFPFGLIEIVFDVQSGLIQNAYVYSDSNDSLFIDKIKKKLTHCDYKGKYKYTKEGLSSMLSLLNESCIGDHRMKEIERVFINKLI